MADASATSDQVLIQTRVERDIYDELEAVAKREQRSIAAQLRYYLVIALASDLKLEAKP